MTKTEIGLVSFENAFEDRNVRVSQTRHPTAQAECHEVQRTTLTRAVARVEAHSPATILSGGHVPALRDGDLRGGRLPLSVAAVGSGV